MVMKFLGYEFQKDDDPRKERSSKEKGENGWKKKRRLPSPTADRHLYEENLQTPSADREVPLFFKGNQKSGMVRVAHTKKPENRGLMCDRRWVFQKNRLLKKKKWGKTVKGDVRA